MSLVSVIIPSYNCENTIAQTIQSVIDQTHTDWELIVVDDGSPDDAASVVERLMVNEPRIQLIRQANAGVSVARNTGAAAANGAFIAFLDSDDLWYPKKLEIQLLMFENNPDAGCVYSRIDFLDEQGLKSGQVSTPLNEPLSDVELLVENRVCTSSNMMVRQAVFEEVGGFIAGMNFAEDQEWLFRIAHHPRWQVVGVMDTLVGYRANADGLSSSPEKMFNGWLTMVDKIRAYDAPFIDKHFHHAQAIYYRYLSRRALRLKQEKTLAWRFFNHAIASDIAVLWTEPKRSLPTFIAALIRRVLPDRLGIQLLTLIKVIPKEVLE